MQRPRTQTIVQIVVLVAITALAVFLVKWGLALLLAVSPETGAAIIAALAGLLIAAATYLFERSKAREDAHREHKIRIYVKFVNFLSGFFFEEKLKALKQKTDFLTDEPSRTLAMLEFKRDMIFWASPDVVNTFTRTLQAFSTPGESDLHSQSRYISACLKAMRKDIGLSNKGLSDDFFVEWIIQDRNELAKFRALGAPQSAPASP